MSTASPYQPPKAQVVDPADSIEANLAGRGQRLGASLLDMLIGLVYGVPLVLALGMWEYMKAGKTPPPSLTFLSTALGFAFFVLIHGYFLKKTGQTIGKKIVGIRIADLDGDVPSFGKLLALRYLPTSLVLLIPGLGGMLPAIDVLFIFRSDRRCVHDLIAGTQVLRTS
jgi:uncharacterized RDD family membrane protein YckC